MSPDDDASGPAPSPRLGRQQGPSSMLRRWQIRAVGVAGAIAVLAFVLSLLMSGTGAETFRTVATVAAGACAVIGVSFALTGERR